MAYRKYTFEDHAASIVVKLRKMQFIALQGRNLELIGELERLVGTVQELTSTRKPQEQRSTPKYTNDLENQNAYMSREEWAAIQRK